MAEEGIIIFLTDVTVMEALLVVTGKNAVVCTILELQIGYERNESGIGSKH